MSFEILQILQSIARSGRRKVLNQPNGKVGGGREHAGKIPQTVWKGCGQVIEKSADQAIRVGAKQGSTEAAKGA